MGKLFPDSTGNYMRPETDLINMNFKGIMFKDN